MSIYLDRAQVSGMAILGTALGAYCGYKAIDKLTTMFLKYVNGDAQLDQNAKDRQAKIKSRCSWIIGGGLGSIIGGLVGVALFGASARSNFVLRF